MYFLFDFQDRDKIICKISQGDQIYVMIYQIYVLYQFVIKVNKFILNKLKLYNNYIKG